MSACFGIWHQDGSPVAPEALARMDAALASWGQDGGGMHYTGAVALGSRLRFITHEDQSEQQPAQIADCVYVAHVRLDNRAELCRRLAVQETPQLPDSLLVAAAYQHWGLDCVQHLYGDWVVALWDGVQQRLLLARDATGSTGLYWCQRGPALIFATGIGGVLAHPDVAAVPDVRFVANLLTVFDDPEYTTATAYQDIHTLLPGHYLLADARGIRVQTWWQPQQLAPLELPNITEYYDAFLAIYRDAVAQRLRVARGGGVAAMLSGGLDSGSVVALAAPQLAARGQRLRAYTHAPLYAPTGAGKRRIGDELPLAQQTADFVGNVDLRPLRSAHISVTAGIRGMLAIQRQPGHAAGNHYWLQDIWQTARDEGIKVLLSGQNGNATISYTGTGNLWPLLRAGRFVEVATSLRAEQLGAAIHRRLLRPLGRPLWQLQHRWRRPPTLAALTQQSAIHPNLIKEVGLLACMHRAGFDPCQAAIPSQQALARFRLGLHLNGQIHAAWMAAGAATGLDIRDPTAARQLVEFCWRLPDTVFWGRGRQRALIRIGMAQALPPDVLQCDRKGLQSADIGLRVQQDAAAVRAILRQLGASVWARRWLDLSRMEQLLADGVVASSPTPALSRRMRGVLLRGLGVGLWGINL